MSGRAVDSWAAMPSRICASPCCIFPCWTSTQPSRIVPQFTINVSPCSVDTRRIAAAFARTSSISCRPIWTIEANARAFPKLNGWPKSRAFWTASRLRAAVAFASLRLATCSSSFQDRTRSPAKNEVVPTPDSAATRRNGSGKRRAIAIARSATIGGLSDVSPGQAHVAKPQHDGDQLRLFPDHRSETLAHIARRIAADDLRDTAPARDNTVAESWLSHDYCRGLAVGL